MDNQLTLRIYGTVQGVFFRQFTKEKAEELGLTGFVRNEPDGSVYLEAEGDPQKLAKLQEWCQVGPRRANVTRIEAGTGKAKGFDKFEVKK